MKKLFAFILMLICVLGLVGCFNQSPEPLNTFEGSIRTYHEMTDSTWQAEGNTYKFRLEISGRMPNAAVDSTFVYLSNLETITFEQAWKAAGVSSHLDDYFAAEEAILVDWQTE